MFQFAKHDKILVGLKCDIESNRKVQFGEAIDVSATCSYRQETMKYS